jgi:hypothetical protein
MLMARWQGETFRRQVLVWRIVALLAGMAAAASARRLLVVGWRRAGGGDPPLNPAAPGTAWPAALMWAAATGVGVGVARMVMQRGAAEIWQRAAGGYPPGLEKVHG